MLQSQQFAEALLDAAPDAIVVTDGSGAIVRVNSAAERLFGYGRGEMMALTVHDLVPPAHRDRHRDLSERYLEKPATRAMSSPGAQLVAHRSDGTEVPVEIALSPVDCDGTPFVIAIVRDVSARRKLEERLRYLSTRDVLTGVYNRNFFEEEVARVQRGRTPPGGVLVCDIDGLKRVNDTEGHSSGDALIRRAADVLTAAVRRDDVVARIGGDEFAVLFYGAEPVHSEVIMERVCAQLAEHNAAFDGPPLSVSLGFATLERGEAIASALARADSQLYVDKRAKPPSLRR